MDSTPGSGGGSTPSAKKMEAHKVSLLVQDRQKNIELILGRIKHSYSKIRESVMMCDVSVLSVPVVEALINASP